MKLVRKQASQNSKYTEKDHSYRIDCKVGKDVDYPRGVDRSALAVKEVQDDSADKECEDYECGKPYRIPADHHCDMIQCKANRAEYARPLFSYLIRETNKSKTAENEFLKEGVTDCNIESNKDEVILRYADFIE